MATTSTRTDRTRTDALPYVYESAGLEMELTEYAVDASEPGPVPSDGDRELSLENIPGWDTATVYGTITVPEHVVESVFPDEEQEEPPAKLLITVDCLNTHNRLGHVVASAPVAAGEYEWSFDIDRDTVRERVDLTPYLVRTADGSDHTTRYASYKGQRIADDLSWRVQIDEPDDWVGDHMDVRFKSFSDGASPHPDDNIYFLDRSEPEQPRVWVNRDHEPIRDVLSSGGYTGFRPRMRDVISDSIAHQVWTELVLWTASDTSEAGDVEYDWQEAVLTEVGSLMYDEEDPAAIGRLLYEAVNNPENMPQLMNDINEALQQYLGPHETLNDMIRREAP